MLRTAIHNQEKEVVEILKAAGAKGASDLSIALATGDRKRTAALLKSAPLYSKDVQFWGGVLPAAAERGDLETVKVAIESGVPPLVKGPQNSADAYSSAAFEGQYEVLDFLLRQRAPKSDPKELRQALWSAVWNCNPYPEQRSAPDFERCVRLLLDAGAPVRDNEEAKYGIVTTAVFSRYPGGNPRVIEMLVAAGADPNPELEKGKRLTDAIGESFQKKNCSVPNDQVVTALEKVAGVTTNRGN